MGSVLYKYDNIIARRTQYDDLDYVIHAERDKDNAPYIGQWTKEQHTNALDQPDLMHIVIEEDITAKIIGYVILSGLQNPHHNIEIKRIVITDKGKGLGRKTLKIIKIIAFEQLYAHRLWLDVRYKNKRAQNLYLSEGFIREGVMRECVLYDGNYESLILMSILASEYSRIIR
jgi:Acetyltransferases, including N-acetylases of ribosomal proteins